MLGNNSSILQQIAIWNTMPIALATIAVAVVGILFALGRIYMLLMAGVILAIIGSIASIASLLVPS